MFPFAVYVKLILMIAFWKINNYNEITITRMNKLKITFYVFKLYSYLLLLLTYDLIIGIFSFQLVNDPLKKTSFTFLFGYLKTTGILRLVVSTLACSPPGNLNIGIACVGLYLNIFESKYRLEIILKYFIIRS